MMLSVIGLMFGVALREAVKSRHCVWFGGRMVAQDAVWSRRGRKARDQNHCEKGGDREVHRFLVHVFVALRHTALGTELRHQETVGAQKKLIWEFFWIRSLHAEKTFWAELKLWSMM